MASQRIYASSYCESVDHSDVQPHPYLKTAFETFASSTLNVHNNVQF